MGVTWERDKSLTITKISPILYMTQNAFESWWDLCRSSFMMLIIMIPPILNLAPKRSPVSVSK